MYIMSTRPCARYNEISVIVGTSLNWRCLFLKMNKTAWKSTHVPRSAFIYDHGPCKSTYNVFQFQPWLCNQRTHGSVTAGIAGNTVTTGIAGYTVHSSCRYWRSRWVFPFSNQFFFCSNIEFVGQIFSIMISFYILILFL